MLKIAICDDEESERKRTEDLVLAYLSERKELAGKVSLFSSAAELFSEVKNAGGFDFYILDVIMPKISGIELGRRLRAEGDEGGIIYLTSSKDYAVESYDTGAFFYIVKPANRRRFFEVMDKAVAAYKRKKEKSLTVRTKEGLIRIPFDEILYVEQAERAMQYHLLSGATVTSRILREPFVSAAGPLLSDERFLPCGPSFVLNLQRIKAIGGSKALFSTGLSIPLPRAHQKNIKEKWIEYWLREDE